MQTGFHYLPRIEGTALLWTQIENNTLCRYDPDGPAGHAYHAGGHLHDDGIQHRGERISTRQCRMLVRSSLDPAAVIRNTIWARLTLGTLPIWLRPAHRPCSRRPPRASCNFNGEDYFFGNTMVLGGTDENDKLPAGNADDDTVWGDGGNDTH